MSRVTLKDIARVAGVTPMAVSYALRGRPGVSRQRAEEIRKIAREMGYEPDAAAAMLVARKQPVAQGRDRPLVGFLSGKSAGYALFAEACREMGLEAVKLSTQDFPDPARAGRIFWARGVSALCINLGFEDASWIRSLQGDPVWRRFVMVKYTSAHPELPLHLVRHNAFDYMHVALTQVMERGFRRLAVLLFPSGNAVDDDSRLGAVLAYQERHLQKGARIYWRMHREEQAYPLPYATLGWLRRLKPDAVLSQYWASLYSIQEAGWNIGQDLAAAAVLAPPKPVPGLPPISGCDVREMQRAQLSVRLLLDLSRRREAGFPDHPTEYVIEPVWIEGETLRASEKKSSS